jgi:VIT1/CCC1 family predicted Fe2+/Mn2+ transporter
MKNSIKKGLGFGLTSGIITTLGLIVGLNSGTHLKSVVIGGILVIAIADAFSDALGMHISEEANRLNKEKQVWESTFSTLLFKFIFASTFIIPILLFSLETAVTISVIWGLMLISVFSFWISKRSKIKAIKAVFQHLIIAIIVIIITHFVGKFSALLFS